jgi:hypothetical protein
MGDRAEVDVVIDYHRSHEAAAASSQVSAPAQ